MGSLLFTREGACAEVEQVWVIAGKQDNDGHWIQMGGKVAKLSNGAFCHADNIQPFESEKEIRQIFATRGPDGNPMTLPEMQWLLDEILEWFAHRGDFEGQEIQKVVFNRKGFPELEDGSPAEEADIYAYFEPGPALTAAIIGLGKRREADAQAVRAAKPEIYQPTPPPGQPKVAGEGVAVPQKVGKPLTRTQLAKRRATRAANKAAKATPKSAPASQLEAATG